MLKKLLFLTIVFLGVLASKNVIAAQVYRETITPNKLTVEHEDRRGKRVAIDAFRIRGYNVAQLRTLVQACGGSIVNTDEGYQIVTRPENIAFQSIAFSGVTTVNVQFNVTEIMDKSGKFIMPNEPGWVFLTDYNYNWGSIRDVLAAMGLEIKSYSDDPRNAQTNVVIGEIVKTARNMREFPTPSVYAGANPIYIYHEGDIKPSIPNSFTFKNFTDPDYYGEKFWIYARDGAKEVRIHRVDYSDNNGNFVFTVNKLLYTTQLTANDVLVVDSIIPEGIPHMSVTIIGNDGQVHSFVLGYNGRTGHVQVSGYDVKGI